MAELDKKIQKTQLELVQAVLEAQEKRNQERVDMLITNAIKQLKMSRFKPDQTTCLSLIYLARINPKVFNQSNAIKEVLRSLIRRDNGPTNIKGKNDVMLPVLAANILLACCNTSETRQIVLNKIDQWLNGNQKISEIVLHLLAITCMKCQNDTQTINLLIDLRQHWLQYLDDNFDTHGPVPRSLCICVRKLLQSESRTESLLELANFLLKHEYDIVGFAHDVSVLIVERPITLKDMISKDINGSQLRLVFLKIFERLFNQLRSDTPIQPPPQAKVYMEDHAAQQQQPSATSVPMACKDTGPDMKSTVKDQSQPVIGPSGAVKLESKPILIKIEPSEVLAGPSSAKPDPSGSRSDSAKSDTEIPAECHMETAISYSMLYLKLSSCSKTIVIEKIIVEAMLTFIATFGVDSEFLDQQTGIPGCWLRDTSVNNNDSQVETVILSEDLALSSPYILPARLREILIYSDNTNLVDIALENTTIEQLLDLFQLFNLSPTTIDKILAHIIDINCNGQLETVLKEQTYFNDLMCHYAEIGANRAKKLISSR